MTDAFGGVTAPTGGHRATQYHLQLASTLSILPAAGPPGSVLVSDGRLRVRRKPNGPAPLVMAGVARNRQVCVKVTATVKR